MSDIKSKRTWLIATAAGAAGLVIGITGISSASPSVAAPKSAVVVAADTTVTTVAPVTTAAPVATVAPATNVDGTPAAPAAPTNKGTEGAEGNDATEQAALQAQAKVSDADARTAALAAKPGTVTTSKLDGRNGTVVWHIEITTATGFADVNVDAVTGKVIDSRDEATEHQGGGHGDHGSNKDPQHEAAEVKNGNVEPADTAASTAPAANA